MATGCDVCVYIVYERRAISCTGFRRRAGTKLHGDRAEIVRNSCSLRAVSVASARKSYGARAASIRRPRGDSMVTVRSSCSLGHSCTKSVQLYISASVVGWDGT